MEQRGGFLKCNRCLVLFTVSGPSSCFSGGAHDGTGSIQYFLPMFMDALSEGQGGWRRCDRCSSVFFEPNGRSQCPATRYQPPDRLATKGYSYYAHTAKFSEHIAIPFEGRWTGEYGWRWCSRCQALFFVPGEQRAYDAVARAKYGESAGLCANGARHDSTQSGGYVLPRAVYIQ